MRITIQRLSLAWQLRSGFALAALSLWLSATAQPRPFKVAAKLYPVDLLHHQYNALHGGIEVYYRRFSLPVSFGVNTGIHLGKDHQSYQKGYKYKAGLRYYLSIKDTAGSRQPSSFIQVLYSSLNFSQQRQNDHYSDLSGMEWQYESTQLSTRRSGVEAAAGKNLVIYNRLMVEASAGVFIGHLTNRYFDQSGMGVYTPPADNFGWLLPTSTKYRKEGRSFLVRPAVSLGIAYWL